MSQDLRSILLGTSALSAAVAIAFVLTITRRGNETNPQGRDRIVSLLLIAISLQCLHFLEEFVTRFNERFPQLFGLRAWSSEFFVSFNVLWISVWVLSAVGVRNNIRVAFFPIWFFVIAMVVNGVAHPAMAIAAYGYFPGLWTSPLVGIVGLILGLRLWKLTSFQDARTSMENKSRLT